MTVIMRAHDERGIRPVLEIQVKRTIAFTSTDKGFRSVVDQIVLTSRKPEVMPQKKLSAKLARSWLRGSMMQLSIVSAPISSKLVSDPKPFKAAF